MWLDALGDRPWSFGRWGTPGGGTLGCIVEILLAETPITGWFSRVDPAHASLHPRFRWSARALKVGGFLTGHRIPSPRYVPLGAAGPILDWFDTERRAGRLPLLMTTPSYAVELCRQAVEQRRELDGARLVLISEPCTAARRAAIERTGAVPLVRYASTEISSDRLGLSGRRTRRTRPTSWPSSSH